jgi:tetratricopeptide (TPR) repeat protein
VALAPEDENAHDSLGLSYQWAGQYESAIAEYTRALGLNPHFDVALIHRANAYFQQGRYREALEQYQQYIQNAPSDLERARGFETIGLAYLKKGDLSRAEANIRRAARYEKSMTSGLFALALARRRVRYRRLHRCAPRLRHAA